ncbi:Protein CBG07483 [Caenorhabditis briggsae]|uniref:Protein CBG07483 n=1 Tax=Caenorhabditis briggsae TaxID=6238 RepID=A8X4P1_CAEBR|nr:Protein CBG07483 [Caenorhabditis briggsae]CAP27601.1 Protein CBG07483 [Caenorhabditis briggsae]
MAEDVALPDFVNGEASMANGRQSTLPPALSQMIQARIKEINQQRFVPRFPKTSRRTQTKFDWIQSNNGVQRGSGIQVSNTKFREDLEEPEVSYNKRSIGIQTPFVIRTEEKKKNIEYIDWEQLDEDDHMAQIEERQKAIASRRRDNRRRLQAHRGDGTLGDPIFVESSDTEDQEAEDDQQEDPEGVDSVKVEAENFVARFQIANLDSSKLIEKFIADVSSNDTEGTEEKKKNIEYIDWEQLDEDDHMAQIEERQKAIASRRRDNRRRLQAHRGDGTLGDPIFVESSDTEDQEAEDDQQEDPEGVDSVKVEAENFVARFQIANLDSSKLIEKFIADVSSNEAHDTNALLDLVIDKERLQKLPPGVQNMCEMSSMKMVRSLKIGAEKFPHQAIKVAALFVFQQMCPQEHAAEKELFRCLVCWICSGTMDVGNHIQRFSRAIQLVKLAAEDPLSADFPEDIQQILVMMKAEYTTLSQLKQSRTSASSGIRLQQRLKDATSDEEVTNILLEFSKLLAPFALKAQFAKWLLQKKNFKPIKEVLDVE